jgi:hypothetical protein
LCSIKAANLRTDEPRLWHGVERPAKRCGCEKEDEDDEHAGTEEWHGI